MFEESVARVEGVVKTMEQVGAKWQLTEQSFIDVLQAAAWEISEDDVTLGREGFSRFRDTFSCAVLLVKPGRGY